MLTQEWSDDESEVFVVEHTLQHEVGCKEEENQA